MTFVRHYGLQAAEGREEALAAALIKLAGIVGGLPGCHGVEVLHDETAHRQFVFVERWDSKDAHRMASAHLQKDAFVAVMREIADKPSVRDLAGVFLEPA